MKKVVWLILLALAPAAFAEYPRDAAARFKKKFGLDHPAVVVEKRAAELAKAKQPAEDKDGKAVQEAANEACLVAQNSASLAQGATRPCDRVQ